MNPTLSYYSEPLLLFKNDQMMMDPRDGLALFGPLVYAKPEGIRWAAVGTRQNLNRFRHWILEIQHEVVQSKLDPARPAFPGFGAAFQSILSDQPVIEREINGEELDRTLRISDSHQRIFRLVDLYYQQIIQTRSTEDVTPDLWFVVIPEEVYLYGRPQSRVPTSDQIHPDQRMSYSQAKRLQTEPSLFDEDNLLAEEYLYDLNFHNQLKARLLISKIPIQIVRETKIAFEELLPKCPLRSYLELQKSSIAWNLSTAIFYKAGGKPWKLGSARKGVCYVGLVFKEITNDQHGKNACCAAQMFLDSGDGVVFKGAVGPWVGNRRGDYHLNRQNASKIIRLCIDSYTSMNYGNQPKEIFIHGKIAFNDEEWSGFKDAAGTKINVVGVRIRPCNDLKLFRFGKDTVLRGMAYHTNEKIGYLWTKGVVPRLLTYPGLEVPNPLLIDVCRGDADLAVVMRDVLALTKLNYNSCKYADGIPVTLRFADAVGEILTAAPTKEVEIPPLPFKFYI